jgi:uncharacterized membrane protein YphA (DoxX/SURF4 family)
MKAKVILVGRWFMGAIFIFSGANKLFMFLPMPPLQDPIASLMTGMMGTGMFHLLAVTEIVCGVLFLVNRYVPLALMMIAPVLLNILLLHLKVEHSGLPMAVVLIVIWVSVALTHKDRLMGLLKP